jgi:hypothetical protein
MKHLLAIRALELGDRFAIDIAKLLINPYYLTGRRVDADTHRERINHGRPQIFER